jgi:hypothetical protein
MEHGEGEEEKGETPSPKVRVIAPIKGAETKTQLASTTVSPTAAIVCVYHPSVPATYICQKCSKALCVRCAVPHGYLFLCPECYQPPQPMPAQQTSKTPPPSPPRDSIIQLLGGLIVIIGFFMPWVTSNYVSPRTGQEYNDVISGFTIASDYAEVALVLMMAILIAVVEFLMIILLTSPISSEKPPIVIRLMPFFMALLTYVVLAEVALRAENFLSNISIGWFICIIGTGLTLFGGSKELWEFYKDYGE